MYCKCIIETIALSDFALLANHLTFAYMYYESEFKWKMLESYLVHNQVQSDVD